MKILRHLSILTLALCAHSILAVTSGDIRNWNLKADRTTNISELENLRDQLRQAGASGDAGRVNAKIGNLRRRTPAPAAAPTAAPTIVRNAPPMDAREAERLAEQNRIEGWVDKASIIKTGIEAASAKGQLDENTIKIAINQFADINKEFNIIDPYLDLYSKASIINLSTTPKMRESQGLYLNIYYTLFNAAKRLKLNATTLGLRAIGDAGAEQRAKEAEQAIIEGEKAARIAEQTRIESWVDKAKMLQAQIEAIKLKNAFDKSNIESAIQDFAALNNQFMITDPYKDLYSQWSIVNWSATAKMRESQALYLDIYTTLYQAAKTLKLNATNLGLRQVGDAGEAQRSAEQEKAKAEAANKATLDENYRIEQWVIKATAVKEDIQKPGVLNNANLDTFINEFNRINKMYNITNPYDQLYTYWSPNLSITTPMRGSRALYLEIEKMLEMARSKYQKETGKPATVIWQVASTPTASLTNFSSSSTQAEPVTSTTEPVTSATEPATSTTEPVEPATEYNDPFYLGNA